MAVRPGRSTNVEGSSNRRRILDIAREQFAARGYAATTIRSIAEEAGFDVALVVHYFGKKDDLLSACLEMPARAATLIQSVFEGPRVEHGSRLARAYLSLWEEEDSRVQMRALARTGLGSEQIGKVIVEKLGMLTAAPDVADLMAERQIGFKLAMSFLLGIAITRYVLGMPGLVELDFDELVERISPAVQDHLDAAVP